LETLGEIAEIPLGQLSTSNIITNGNLAGGDVIAYRCTTAPNLVGFWISVEDRVGNPVSVSSDGAPLADPGLGSSSVSGDVYGNDGGETSNGLGGIFITTTFIPGAV